MSDKGGALPTATEERPRVTRDLLDRVRRDQPQKGPRCSVTGALNRLSTEERQLVEEALGDPDTYTHEAIAEVLRSTGSDVQGYAVGRHRRGLCKCRR